MSKINSYKRLLINIIIFIGQNTFLGRGFIKNQMIRAIHKIINFDPINDPIESRIQTTVDGVPFYFYFDRLSETKQVMGSYNKKEIDFIKNEMKDNDVFIDVGANIGFYTQNIASIYNTTKFSKIISIEPNPLLCERLQNNLSLLDKINIKIKKKVIIENFAIGNQHNESYLNLSRGYGNASVTNKNSLTSIKIQMTSLLNIVQKNNINNIKILKIDIEGYEDLALIPYFENVEKKLYPNNIIIEHSSYFLWRQNIIEFLFTIGYRELFKTKSNMILSRDS